MKKLLINTKKFSKKPTLVWVVLAFFVILNVYVAIQASASGVKISYFEVESRKVVQDNQALSSKLIELNSLKRLEGNAEGLGFIKPESIIYITGDAVVAQKP